jgi:hypothetical protein
MTKGIIAIKQQQPIIVYTTNYDLRFDCGWRWSRLSVWLAYIILPLLLFQTGCQREQKQNVTDLLPVITSHRWTKELGDGALRECYVYTFHTNGTYTASVFSDYGARPIRGTWHMTNLQGQIHLRLRNQEAYYFCVWHDSILRYDKERDVLVVSGPHYTNQMDLQHVKGKPATIGNRTRAFSNPARPLLASPPSAGNTRFAL